MIDPQLIVDGLSKVQRTANGSSYAFTALDLSGKEVQELGAHLRPYGHLLTLNMSNNDIRDISEISNLEYLLQVNAATNQIKDISFFTANPDSLKYLQVSG